MKQWAVAVAFAVGLSAGGSAAFAADPGVAAEIELLKERLASLEQKLAQQEARSVGAAPESAIIQLPIGLHGVKLSGFVDTAYTYNFNEPRDQVNDGRTFDTTANSFVLHNLQLNIEKAADVASPIGFKGVLMFGDDAESTHSTGLFTAVDGDQDSIDIQQAYVEYLADIGEGLTLTFGKQATLIGAEVIESMDNWNYSRSFLFGLAIPFTHTGFRASYPLTETVGIAMGVNNGWDIADDNNIGKGIEGQVSWAPNEDVFISVQGMYSPERSPGTGALINNGADRWIVDLVGTYQATPELVLMVNYDYGHQEDNAAIGKNAGWQGLATYAKYTLSDTWSLAGRYEIFRDYDAFRAPGSLSGSGFGDLTLQEFTLTSEHLIADRLIARLEYRHDIANGDVFGHDATGLKNYQDTVAVEVILPF